MTDTVLAPPPRDLADFYRQISETIPHMVWATRPTGEFEFCNATCAEYTGRSIDELSGDGWRESVHPEDLPECLAIWMRCLASGTPFDFRYRLRRYDGSFRWHQARALPLRDASGAILRWFGTCTDIDDQVRAGQRLEEAVEQRTAALLESEARFRSLLALSSDWYWEQDTEFRFTAITRASEENRPPLPKPIGKRRWDVGYFNMTDADWAAHRATLEAHQPFRDLVLCAIGTHGEPVWVSTSGEPIFSASGAFAGYRGIGRDITAQRRAEEALRKSEQRFQAFMDHSPVIAWIKDANLRYTYVSEPFLHRLGKKNDDLLGRSDLECWPQSPEAGRRSWEHDRIVQRERTPLQSMESGPVPPTGTVHHWLSNKFPLPDDSGAIGVAGTAIDISERVEAEEAARLYADEVRALLDRLISTQETERKRVASELHDLIGQNLTALGIWLTNIANVLGSRDEAIRRQVESMQRTVEQTIEAIRGVMSELRPVGLDEYGLVPALRSYASDFQARTSLRTTIECAVPIGRLAPQVEVSLFRIVQEALTNSAKHSGASTVRVVVERSAARVRIGVEDDGQGFADPVGARKTHRGGWGLPAIRERAEACGGKLRVEHLSRGVRLVVEVPVDA